MKRSRIAALALSLAIAGGAVVASSTLRAADEKPAAKKDIDSMPCCPIDPKAQAALDKVKGLTGTWTSTAPAPEGQKPLTLVFRPTAAGSAVIETMFPGTNHEMVNLYTADGQTILLTHYCAQGVQPRMRLNSNPDAKAMKFEFVDGGNIKSRNDPHMDAVTLTIDGDKLTEDWAFYADGKVVDHKVFEFKRQ
jgi:hypothetical protein